MSEKRAPHSLLRRQPSLGGRRHRLRGAEGSFWEKYQNQTR